MDAGCSPLGKIDLKGCRKSRPDVQGIVFQSIILFTVLFIRHAPETVDD